MLLAAVVVPGAGVVRAETATDDGPAPRVVPVRFSIAPNAGRLGPDGEPRARRADPATFLAAQLARANEIFRPLGVSFVEAGRDILPPRHGRMEDRRDRHALGPRVAEGVIHVFVVAFLRDVDEPGRSRMGVHWTPRGVDGIRPGAHLIILAGYAHEGVLAHELGHYLGNPRHSDQVGNVMSYDWGERPVPVFDPTQARRIRRFLDRAFRGAAFDPDKPRP